MIEFTEYIIIDRKKSCTFYKLVLLLMLECDVRY